LHETAVTAGRAANLNHRRIHHTQKNTNPISITIAVDMVLFPAPTQR
jgi:hypothetical protein